MPGVSVIMPVYNCVAYIRESVESILQQTFADFEFIITDDHSTDGTYEYLQTVTDKRIQLTRKPKNSGYTNSLNMGLEMAKGIYIARMDGDDIALPERLEKQVSFMNNNPNVAVSGCFYKMLGTDTIVEMPVTNEEAKVVAIMHVPVAHPTVIMRREVLIKHHFFYNEKYEPAEDYDLWTRILEVADIENLPEVLLQYRRHAQQESITKYNRLIDAAVEIRERQLTKLISFENKKYDILFAISILTKEQYSVTSALLKKTAMLLSDMYQSNKKRSVYDEPLLYDYLRSVWLFIYINSTRLL